MLGRWSSLRHVLKSNDDYEKQVTVFYTSKYKKKSNESRLIMLNSLNRERIRTKPISFIYITSSEFFWNNTVDYDQDK